MTSAAQWSPPGDAILFGLGQYFRNRAQGAQVAMIKPDGSGFLELTSGANNPQMDSRPSRRMASALCTAPSARKGRACAS